MLIFLVILILIYIVLNVIDYVLTKKVLNRGGIELNLFQRWIGPIPAKIIGTLVIVGGYIYTRQISVWIGIDVVLLCICIWNYFQYLKITGSNVRHK